MTTAADNAPRFKARAAGFFYLLMLPISGYHQFVGARFLRPMSDAATTAANILGHPILFQSALAVDLLVVACYLAVTALFYELFKPVNSTVSLMAALCSLAGCITQAFAALFHIAPLILLTGVQSLTAIQKEQMEAQAFLMLKLYSPAYCIGLVFFALYLVLIGRLIFKSTFMPRLLGLMVTMQGFAGLIFLWPPLAKTFFPILIVLTAAGEGVLMFWLLIVGVNVERWHARAASARE